jgi:tetratricopeptide (TPR) repeat protein
VTATHALSSVLLLAGLTIPARAAPLSEGQDAKKQAQQRYTQALVYYNAQKYADAVAMLKDAYTLDPRPEYLYSLGQAERMAGDCTDALAAYRAYLRTNPEPRRAEYVRRNMDRCTERSDPQTNNTTETDASPAPPMTNSQPVPLTGAPAPAPTAQPESLSLRTRGTRSPFYKDPLGDVLSAVGIAGLASGAALFATGRHDVGAANDAKVYQDFVDRSGGEPREVAGIVVMGVGGALLIGGIVRYVVRPTRMHPESGH